jgi:hypothetical protein
MHRRRFLELAGAALTARAQGRGDIDGAARDFLNQALEQLWEHSTPKQVDSALFNIRMALDEDPQFGDAHYYRALCLQRSLRKSPKTANDPVAAALDSATMYHSEALAAKRDPFRLAAPQIVDEYLQEIGEKWALVVGISKFRNHEVPRLNYGAADAAAMRDLLTDPKTGRFRPERVTALIDDQAVTSAIKENLDRIATKAKPQDVVLIYFATHGSSRDTDHRQVSYLYTHDTDVRRPEKVFGTALALVEVSGIVSTRCRALRTILIFDTCHSGAALAAQTLSEEDRSRLKAGAGRYILSSCGIDQLSYEGEGHGLFTQSLIEAISAKGGCLRMQELFANVQADVSRKTQGKQQPVMTKSDNAAEVVIGAQTGSGRGSCGA